MMNGWQKKTNGRPASGGVGRFVSGLFELTKVHLSLYIALSAVAGHVLAENRFTGNSFSVGACVLLLAAGAGVLNNIQDRNYDRQFKRTRSRVLPRRVFSLKWAWATSGALAGMALVGLFWISSKVFPVALGLLALICYNGVYTPMKKKSLWAMVPGIVCGMIPPGLGWVAASDRTADLNLPGLMILMVCLGIWQFPHYLLVGGGTREAAISDEAGLNAGFRRIWPGRAVYCQVLIWTVLFSMGVMLFLLHDGSVGLLGDIVLFVVSLALPPVMLICLFYSNSKGKKIGFSAMNISMLVFLSTILLERLI